MKRAAAVAVAAVVLLAGSAQAQCLGDFNGDFKVEINEIVVSVNNALSDCAGVPTPTPTPLGGSCPVNFLDNTVPDTAPRCIYAGRWNADCGAADLEALWISDGSIAIIQIALLTDVFLAADVRSADAGELFGWFTKSDASDLVALSGPVVLGDSGRTLVVAPCTAPFSIEMCDFARYEGLFTDVTSPPAALRAGAAARLDGAAFGRLRALHPHQSRPNLQRR